MARLCSSGCKLDGEPEDARHTSRSMKHVFPRHNPSQRDIYFSQLNRCRVFEACIVDVNGFQRSPGKNFRRAGRLTNLI